MLAGNAPARSRETRAFRRTTARPDPQIIGGLAPIAPRPAGRRRTWPPAEAAADGGGREDAARMRLRL
jgi:hypothetical protein